LRWPIVHVPQRRGSSFWLTCAKDLLHRLHLAPLDLHHGREGIKKTDRTRDVTGLRTLAQG
jgi:hypothetical protein